MAELTLEAEQGSIRINGRARINPEDLDRLGISEGELAVLSSDYKDILVSIFSDIFVEKGKIIIREDDMKKLKVGGGDTVELTEHQSLLNQNFLDKLL
ncbi:MAG: hypothetical protein R6U61_05805 [Thermoplasmata archaeon]